LVVTHKHRPSESSDEYATPPWLWRSLGRAVGGFDVDPASGAESAPIAKTQYTRADDGLAKQWYGDVWLNPPFGDAPGASKSKRETWLLKARNEINREDVRTITMLLPVDTSTDWFHDHVIPANVICLMDRRLKFEGEDGNASFATMIVVFGDAPDALVKTLEELGSVFRGREYHESTTQTRFEV